MRHSSASNAQTFMPFPGPWGCLSPFPCWLLRNLPSFRLPARLQATAPFPSPFSAGNKRGFTPLFLPPTLSRPGLLLLTSLPVCHEHSSSWLPAVPERKHHFIPHTAGLMFRDMGQRGNLSVCLVKAGLCSRQRCVSVLGSFSPHGVRQAQEPTAPAATITALSWEQTCVQSSHRALVSSTAPPWNEELLQCSWKELRRFGLQISSFPAPDLLPWVSCCLWQHLVPS